MAGNGEKMASKPKEAKEEWKETRNYGKGLTRTLADKVREKRTLKETNESSDTIPVESVTSP